MYRAECFSCVHTFVSCHSTENLRPLGYSSGCDRGSETHVFSTTFRYYLGMKGWTCRPNMLAMARSLTHRYLLKTLARHDTPFVRSEGCKSEIWDGHDRQGSPQNRHKTAKTRSFFKRLVPIDMKMIALHDPHKLSRIRRPWLSSLGRGLHVMARMHRGRTQKRLDSWIGFLVRLDIQLKNIFFCVCISRIKRSLNQYCIHITLTPFYPLNKSTKFILVSFSFDFPEATY